MDQESAPVKLLIATSKQHESSSRQRRSKFSSRVLYRQRAALRRNWSSLTPPPGVPPPIGTVNASSWSPSSRTGPCACPWSRPCPGGSGGRPSPGRRVHPARHRAHLCRPDDHHGRGGNGGRGNHASSACGPGSRPCGLCEWRWKPPHGDPCRC